MIVTVTPLLDSQIIIAAINVEDKPRLLFIDWLTSNSDGEWQWADWLTSQRMCKLKRHYKLEDADITFIDKNSLSDTKPVEALLLNTIKQLVEYQSGRRQTFNLPLDVSIGTAFQQKVWQALRQIPYGETISYAMLAEQIAQPTAFRAVANANGKNPFSIIIPCHRVIASDGGLGGYTGGIDKKKKLLAIEKLT